MVIHETLLDGQFRVGIESSGLPRPDAVMV